MSLDFLRYLAAKKPLDDRCRNGHVWQALGTFLAAWPKSATLKVLEVGCGIGTMVERLLERQLLPPAVYTAIDSHPPAITAAGPRLAAFAAAQGGAAAPGPSGTLSLTLPGTRLLLRVQAADLYAFAARPLEHQAADLVIAHALLDLLKLERALTTLSSLLRPGGAFYFSLNFDGVTTFLPLLDPTLDHQIESAYHHTMDSRTVAGSPSGSSHTGRHLFTALPEAGLHIHAAGSSDWAIFPRQGRYPDDEAVVLGYLLDTVQQALQGQPGIPARDLNAWLRHRRRQLADGQLIYLTHQWDFFGFKP